MPKIKKKYLRKFGKMIWAIQKNTQIQKYNQENSENTNDDLKKGLCLNLINKLRKILKI